MWEPLTWHEKFGICRIAGVWVKWRFCIKGMFVAGESTVVFFLKVVIMEADLLIVRIVNGQVCDVVTGLGDGERWRCDNIIVERSGGAGTKESGSQGSEDV